MSLSRSKRQAQYTLESIAEGVITTDNDGRIDYMNLAAEALIGTNRDDAAGHRVGELFTLVDDADRRPLGDPVERCLAMRRRVNMGRRAVHDQQRWRAGTFGGDYGVTDSRAGQQHFGHRRRVP